MSNRRVVVTGTGIWSCLGTSLEAVKKSLYEGHSGIGIAPERIEIGYQSALTGIVERPVLKGILDRPSYPHGAFGRGRIRIYGKS